MQKAKYGIGDIVTLLDGPLRHAGSAGRFTILAVLPHSDGQVQYRVRSEAEGYDRRVAASDIDTEQSAVSRHAPVPPAEKANREPWFKASAIKVRK
jgi:hypothetical protein